MMCYVNLPFPSGQLFRRSQLVRQISACSASCKKSSGGDSTILLSPSSSSSYYHFAYSLCLLLFFYFSSFAFFIVFNIKCAYVCVCVFTLQETSPLSRYKYQTVALTAAHKLLDLAYACNLFLRTPLEKWQILSKN